MKANGVASPQHLGRVLIKRIIAVLGIEHEPAVHTPTTALPLIKVSAGDPPDETFSYPSVIGMLGYLQGNSRPDIAYAVSSAASQSQTFPRRGSETHRSVS
jgi:hypothetical protein